MKQRLLLSILLVAICASIKVAQAEQSPADRDLPSDPAKGEGIYQTVCATCHENNLDSRAPARAVLGLMSPESIHQALANGLMKEVGSSLDEGQRRSVAHYLTKRAYSPEVIPPQACPLSRMRFDPEQPPALEGWGFDQGNSHSIPANVSGISRSNVTSMHVKWVLGFPSAVRARSQPAIAAGALFVGSHDGTVYALDRETGCTRWTFKARAEVRTAIVIAPWARGRAPARPLLYFGDLVGNIYALNAFTGGLIWTEHTDPHPAVTLTAAPALHGGRLYVPVSSIEEATRTDMRPCCTFRGSVIAYDALTGARLWQTFMTDAPGETGKTDKGVKTFGPSGAAIWNTPTVDVKRRRIYLGTGDNYSNPTTSTSDALVALDMESGRIIWTRQTVEGDIWPFDGPDADWGAPPVLASTSEGREVLVAGQKSGTVYGVDPEDGSVLWKTEVGRGGIGGGVQFGIAVEGNKAFVPIHDRKDGRSHAVEQKPGMYALDIHSGAYVWRAPQINSCGNKSACYPGYAAAITATSGIVIAGNIDGYVRAFDGTDGQVLWEFDTSREFVTVNGELAHGGSIAGGSAPVVYHGMMFLNSGYSAFSGTQAAGNVLIAFEVNQKAAK